MYFNSDIFLNGAFEQYSHSRQLCRRGSNFRNGHANCSVLAFLFVPDVLGSTDAPPLSSSGSSSWMSFSSFLSLLKVPRFLLLSGEPPVKVPDGVDATVPAVSLAKLSARNGVSCSTQPRLRWRSSDSDRRRKHEETASTMSSGGSEMPRRTLYSSSRMPRRTRIVWPMQGSSVLVLSGEEVPRSELDVVSLPGLSAGGDGSDRCWSGEFLDSMLGDGRSDGRRGPSYRWL